MPIHPTISAKEIATRREGGVRNGNAGEGREGHVRYGQRDEAVSWCKCFGQEWREVKGEVTRERGARGDAGKTAAAESERCISDA